MAIQRASLGGLPASLADWWEASRYTRNLSTVDILVTDSTERDAVGSIVSQCRIAMPFLYVMRLYLALGSALLAFIVVAFIYSIAPASVFPRVALFVGIILAGGFITAIMATELRCFAVALRKLNAAMLAGKQGRGIVSSRANGRAGNSTFRCRALESVVTDRASCRAARIAFYLNRPAYAKRLSAYGTIAGDVIGRRRLGNGSPVNTASTGLVAARNELATFGAFFRLGTHRLSLARFAYWRKLQRLSDMGLEPRLEHIRLDNG